MDDLEATRRIRAEDEARGLVRVPILALTAHAAESQRRQCLAAGMDSLMTKPIILPARLREIAEAVAPPAN